MKETDYISLAEYAWEFHKKNDLNMEDAVKLKEVAFGFAAKKIRFRKDIRTPLLRSSNWHPIWDKHFSS